MVAREGLAPSRTSAFETVSSAVSFSSTWPFWNRACHKDFHSCCWRLYPPSPRPLVLTHGSATACLLGIDTILKLAAAVRFSLTGDKRVGSLCTIHSRRLSDSVPFVLGTCWYSVIRTAFLFEIGRRYRIRTSLQRPKRRVQPGYTLPPIKIKFEWTLRWQLAQRTTHLSISFWTRSQDHS